MIAKLSTKILAGTVAVALSGSACLLPGTAKTSGSGSGQDDPGCRSCVSQAATLFAGNQLEKSSALLNLWSKKCPHNAQLHLLLSTILIRLGSKNIGEAESEAAIATNLEPDLQAAHFQYGMVLLAQEKYAPAAREFEIVSNLNPGSYEAWSELADLYKRLRKDPEAAKAAEKAAALEPGAQAAKMAVLMNLKRAGRIPQAKRELKRLILESQASPELQQSLANEAIQLGAYAEAIEACDNVVKAYPNSMGPVKCLMIAQLLLRKYTEAESSADKILAQEKSAEIKAVRALCKLNTGKMSEAEADLKAAQALDPSSGFTMLADGLLKMSKGNFEDATDTLKFASETYTKGSQFDKVPQGLAHLALSRLNRKQGLVQEAVQEAHAAATDKRFSAEAHALEARSILSDSSRPDSLSAAGKMALEAVTEDPEAPETLLAQAFYQLKAEKFDEARKNAEKAATASPANADAKLALALIAGHAGNSDLERSELEKGLNFANNDPELLYALGTLYLKTNKTAEALPVLKQAVEGRVRGPEIVFALAEAFEKNGNSGESLKYYKQSMQQGLSGENSNQAKAAISRLESGK